MGARPYFRRHRCKGAAGFRGRGLDGTGRENFLAFQAGGAGGLQHEKRRRASRRRLLVYLLTSRQFALLIGQAARLASPVIAAPVAPVSGASAPESAAVGAESGSPSSGSAMLNPALRCRKSTARCAWDAA